jgi:hypothetical protein
MGSLNFCADQEPYKNTYSYKTTLNYQYSPKSTLRKIDEISGNSDSRLLLLKNSVYYFLECVYILYSKGSYRLVVLHNNRLLTYKNYNSLKGAKIAFQKIYKGKAWKAGVKAKWNTSVLDLGNYSLAKKESVIKPTKPLKAYSI